jgi:predicted  nucleic acid-binding Zn-ribbon protein
VTEHDEQPGLRDRLSRQGEEALGKIAEELVGNPVVTAAVSRAFEAREKAVQAQEAAMGALNIPSAADIERLTRRLRSVAQRLEGIEDALDRIEERVDALGGPREAALPREAEERIDEIHRDIAALRATLARDSEPPPRSQERLKVTE